MLKFVPNIPTVSPLDPSGADNFAIHIDQAAGVKVKALR